MDSSSKKYILLLTLICIVFAIFTFKAFDYLPDKSVDSSTNINVKPKKIVSINTKENTSDDDENKEKIDENDNQQDKSGHIDFTNKDNTNSIQAKQLEEISTPKGVEEELVASETNKVSSNSLSPDEQAIKFITNGRNYKLNSENDKAILEFEKAIDITDNKELLAMGYENLAEIYAGQRRFGKALTYADKAYTYSPSTNREMLIARIYYISGDRDNATNRLNALLKRGFN